MKYFLFKTCGERFRVPAALLILATAPVTLVRVISAQSQSAPSLITIVSPKFNQTLPSGTVTAQIQLSGNARPETLVARLNGQEVDWGFIMQSNCGSAGVCEEQAALPQELLVRGTNVFTVDVSSSSDAAGAARIQFEYTGGAESLDIPVRHLVPGVAVNTNYLPPEADPNDYTKFHILIGPGADYPQRDYSAADLGCPAGINSVQVLVLNQVTLDPDTSVSGGTSHVGQRCFGDVNSLQTFLRSLTEGRLVIANSFYGEMPSLNTTAIGGTDYTKSGSRGSRDYSIIGVAGASPGLAYESYQPFHQAQAYIPPLVGTLALDNLQRYFFVPLVDRQFEVIPNNFSLPLYSSSVAYAGSVFQGKLPFAVFGGFYLFGIDRQRGYLQYSDVYSTFQSDQTKEMPEMRRLAADLSNASPDILFVLTTIGRPFRSSNIDASLFRAISDLGGSAYVLPELAENKPNGGSNTYTLISGKDPDLSGPTGWLVEQSSLWSKQGETGAVEVLLNRNRRNRWTPDTATPEFLKENGGLLRVAEFGWQKIAAQQPQNWPAWTPGQLNAYNDLTSGKYTTINFDLGCLAGTCRPIRSYYSGVIGGGGSAALNVNYGDPGLRYIANGEYTEEDFNGVITQLRTEQGFLSNVQADYLLFAAVTGNVQDSFQHQLGLAARTIESPIRDSNAQAAITSQKLNIAASAVSILSGIPGAGAAFSALSGALRTVSTLYAGQNGVPESYQIVLQQLLDGNATLGTSMAEGNNILFTGIVNDWGKLQTVGAGYAAQVPPWYMCSTCLNSQIPISAIPAMSAGARQEYYRALIPNLYFLDQLSSKNTGNPKKLSVRVPYGRNLYVCYAPYEGAPANKYFSFSSPYVASAYDLYFFVQRDRPVKIPFPAYVQEPVYVPDSLIPALFDAPVRNQDGSLGGGAGLIFKRFTAGSGRPVTFRPGYLPGTQCPLAAADDFELDVETTPLTVSPGSQVSTELVVSGQGSFDGEVTFSCSNLPTGATCSFAAPSVEVGEGAYVPNTVTISTTGGSANLHPSTAEIVVHATSGPLTHSATISLTVP